jgi:OOP family OmpA-OmpF porin
MKNLLLTLSLMLAVMPVQADELSPTSAKDTASDLPPPRTSPSKPGAPVEAAPVEVAPQAAPTVEKPLPPAAEPVVVPAVAPAETAPAPRTIATEAAPMARPTDTGWFAGVGIGYSENRGYACNGCGAAIGSLDDSGFAYKLFGGYRLHRNFALSAGYMDLADTRATGVGGGWNDKLKVDGFYAAAQGILPVTDKIDLFATAGFLRWDQNVAFNGSSGTVDGTDPMYGLGASYALNKPGAKLQFEWNRLTDVGTNDASLGNNEDDYDLFTVNLLYQF